MAYEIPGFTYSLPAAADLSTHQWKFIKMNTSGQAALAGAGCNHSGVLQNDPEAAGRPCTVMHSGISKVIAGGTVTVGAYAEIDASGRAIVTAGAAGDECVGMFMTAGAVGEVVSILLDHRTIPA